MEQKLTQLQAKLEGNNALVEKLFSLETPEEVQGLLKGEGLDFSLEEIKVVKEALVKVLAKGSSELSDDELENVAGGSIVATVAIVGAIAGIITAGAAGLTAAGTVVDSAVRSRW